MALNLACTLFFQEVMAGPDQDLGELTLQNEWLCRVRPDGAASLTAAAWLRYCRANKYQAKIIREASQIYHAIDLKDTAHSWQTTTAPRPSHDKARVALRYDLFEYQQTRRTLLDAEKRAAQEVYRMRKAPEDTFPAGSGQAQPELQRLHLFQATEKEARHALASTKLEEEVLRRLDDMLRNAPAQEPESDAQVCFRTSMHHIQQICKRYSFTPSDPHWLHWSLPFKYFSTPPRPAQKLPSQAEVEASRAHARSFSFAELDERLSQ